MFATSESLETLRQQYKASLQQFNHSSKSFQLVDTITLREPSRVAPQTALYVLDSSFNPPTVVHTSIAASALRSARNRYGASGRLLLLLATQNADKPSKPASFEARLVMMRLLAQDLLETLDENSANQTDLAAGTAIDIGITKQPYFVDKAISIANDNGDIYPKDLVQTHLIGYDTLVRIFDPKYYPPDHNLNVLEPFLSQHKLSVTLRVDTTWGGREEQLSFLTELGSGAMERIGGKREWVDRIEVAERGDAGEPVSSTRARDSARTGNTLLLQTLVTPRVQQYIMSQDLYKDS
ncbi:hypothetical protein FQN57_005836 [Myotisia sp. PD_48]|nr:hypothetical protein FQN57_005836 [Myotisia sp. PD_48]